jgi:hypothetical protein
VFDFCSLEWSVCAPKSENKKSGELITDNGVETKIHMTMNNPERDGGVETGPGSTSGDASLSGSPPHTSNSPHSTSSSTNAGTLGNGASCDVHVAFSPANTAMSGQSAFSYSQMSGLPPTAGGAGGTRASPCNPNLADNNGDDIGNPRSYDPPSITQIGSTVSNQTQLTTVTDWTQMEQNYRESSVCTEAIEANGLKNPLSFGIICAVIFVGEMARGIMLPTLWGFVQELGGDTVTMGYSVAAFSFGRVVTSPIFGYLSVERGYRFTLTIALSVLSAGAFLYAQAGVVGHTLFLIFAQTVSE